MLNNAVSKVFVISTICLLCMTAPIFSRGLFISHDFGNKNAHDISIDTNTNGNFYGFSVKDRLSVIQYQKIGTHIPITGDLEQMKYFLNALKNSKNQKVRIAHYGDSLIMGDIITEYLRNDFQIQYGGYGVGMLSIIADDSRMRRTITHTYSDDWTYASIVSGNRELFPLGMNGTVCVPKPGSWVQYESTRLFEKVSSFNQVRLFYSNADNTSTIEYSFDNDKPATIRLKSGLGVQQLILNAKQKAIKMKIKFVSGKAPYMFGISLESEGNGVCVDNYSLRGNSGVSLLDISSDTYNRYDQYINYSLIILNFGANVSFSNHEAYMLYEVKMEEVIRKLKKAFPKTSFLLVGTGDKTMKRGSRYMTNPDIPFLVGVQKKIVEKTGIAFWNLWEAMGGDNSMYSWVNATPSLAYKDYVHFNSEGGEIIANLLFEAITNIKLN